MLAWCRCGNASTNKTSRIDTLNYFIKMLQC